LFGLLVLTVIFVVFQAVLISRALPAGSSDGSNS
ncbi:MAG: septation protein A, partial [Acidithiobacillus sp.]